jgi:hypothetical protein
MYDRERDMERDTEIVREIISSFFIVYVGHVITE